MSFEETCNITDTEIKCSSPYYPKLFSDLPIVYGFRLLSDNTVNRLMNSLRTKGEITLEGYYTRLVFTRRCSVKECTIIVTGTYGGSYCRMYDYWDNIFDRKLKVCASLRLPELVPRSYCLPGLTMNVSDEIPEEDFNLKVYLEKLFDKWEATVVKEAIDEFIESCKNIEVLEGTIQADIYKFLLSELKKDKQLGVYIKEPKKEGSTK